MSLMRNDPARMGYSIHHDGFTAKKSLATVFFLLEHMGHASGPYSALRMRVMDERWRAVNRTELMFLIYLEAPRPEGSRRTTGVVSMGRGSDDLGIIHLKSSRG